MPYSTKEKISEYNKGYNERNKERNKEKRELNKEKKREYDKKYRELNKKKISKYKELNKEKHREYYKEYNQLNKEKKAEYYRELREKNKAICVEYLGGKCVKCGDTERLEFDHIKREGKKYSIGGKVTNNLNNLKEELNKCQLLCYDCHKIKTKSERTILTETCKMKHTQRGDG